MNEVINLNHGAGGKVFNDFLNEVICPIFENSFLNELSDGAILSLPENSKLVMATDSHVVSPRKFPGGSLGKLAFCGTVNDLAVMGAKPLYLSLSLIIEEGFSVDELKFHLQQIAKLSKDFEIPIVTGDTKVVERNKADGLFINTTGIGTLLNIDLYNSPHNIEVGDVLIINGTIGNHGISVLSQREHLDFETQIVSDCEALHPLILKLWEEFPSIKFMRDPTRGGVATLVNEVANSSEKSIELIEKDIPIDQAVQSACELMGFDPLSLANEGKFILFCKKSEASKIIELMRSHPLGEKSAIIGQVIPSKDTYVSIKTNIGGERLLPFPLGDPLPRIC